jgi:hypothetical protein
MNHSTKSFVLALLAATPYASAFAQQGACKVNLTQDPLVMRIGKDEFRIAFGLDGSSCHDVGCSGVITYYATWETDEGMRNTERKSVSFEIPNDAQRSLTVDRSYFDTREAQHTTRITGVDVAGISCVNGPANDIADR